MKIEWQDYSILIVLCCCAISLLAEDPYVKIGFSLIELVIMFITTIIIEKKLNKEEKEDKNDDN